MTKRDTQAREYAAEAPHAAEAPRTVRVRIAVAVDEKGQYSAHGWWPRPLKDADVMARSQGCLVSRVTSCVWIEADVPLPVPQTISGEVTS